MKILAIHKHYWPDAAPYSRLLKPIVDRLAKDGHEVTVLTAQPNYNDIKQARQPWLAHVDGVEVRRVALLPERKRFVLLRAINFTYLLFRAGLHAVFAGKYDLIITATHPPILMGLTLVLLKHLTGVRYLIHCQDIHPESARQVGKIRSAWLYRLLQRLDSVSCREAELVVALSDDMKSTLAERGLDVSHVRSINNFPVNDGWQADVASLPALLQQEAPERLRLLFAGNIGEFQGLERIIDAALQLGVDSPIQFIFMGEGSAKAALVERAGELVGRTVHFLPFQPVEVAFAAMQRADLGIVALSPGVYKTAYPSKSMMYLAAGCPLFAVIEPESELTRLVHEHRLGYAVAGENTGQIVATLLRAHAERRAWTPQERRRITEQSDSIFGRERVLADWSGILRELESNACRPAGSSPSVTSRAA